MNASGLMPPPNTCGFTVTFGFSLIFWPVSAELLSAAMNASGLMPPPDTCALTAWVSA